MRIGSHLAVSGSCPQSLPNMVMRLYQRSKRVQHMSTLVRRSFAPLRGAHALLVVAIA